MDNRHLAT